MKRVKHAAFGFKKFANFRIRALLHEGKPDWAFFDTLTPPSNVKRLLVEHLERGGARRVAKLDRFAHDRRVARDLELLQLLPYIHRDI